MPFSSTSFKIWNRKVKGEGRDWVQDITYPLLELCTLIRRECVCLGYDWDDVDLHTHHQPTRKNSDCYTLQEKAHLFMELLHKCYINLLQPAHTKHAQLTQRTTAMRVLPMSSGSYEVQTAVDTSVLQHIPHHTRLLVQIFFILCINVLDDGRPATHTTQSIIQQPCCIPWAKHALHNPTAMLHTMGQHAARTS